MKHAPPPGDSGGPVLDANGRVVGIADQIATDGNADQSSGVGFAVPIDLVKSSLKTLEAGGTAQHAYLGVATGAASSATAGATVSGGEVPRLRAAPHGQCHPVTRPVGGDRGDQVVGACHGGGAERRDHVAAAQAGVVGRASIRDAGAAATGGPRRSGPGLRPRRRRAPRRRWRSRLRRRQAA